MILNKKVFIKKNTYMKKYYESKGYIYKDIDSDYMEVKITDKLPDDKFLLDTFNFCTNFLKETDAFKIEVDLDNKTIKV